MVSEIREYICVNSLSNDPISRIQIRNQLIVYCLYVQSQYVIIHICVCVCVYVVHLFLKSIRRSNKFIAIQMTQIFRPVRKIANVNISFVMSVCLSVCLSVRMEHHGSHRTNFHEISYSSIFLNLYRQFNFHENRTMTDTLHGSNTHLRQYLAKSSTGNEKCSEKSFRENLKQTIYVLQFYSSKIVPFVR